MEDRVLRTEDAGQLDIAGACRCSSIREWTPMNGGNDLELLLRTWMLHKIYLLYGAQAIAAESLGLKIPSTHLATADEVIE